jgi:hypothetical protein
VPHTHTHTHAAGEDWCKDDVTCALAQLRRQELVCIKGGGSRASAPLWCLSPGAMCVCVCVCVCVRASGALAFTTHTRLFDAPCHVCAQRWDHADQERRALKHMQHMVQWAAQSVAEEEEEEEEEEETTGGKRKVVSAAAAAALLAVGSNEAEESAISIVLTLRCEPPGVVHTQHRRGLRARRGAERWA